MLRLFKAVLPLLLLLVLLRQPLAPSVMLLLLLLLLLLVCVQMLQLLHKPLSSVVYVADTFTAMLLLAAAFIAAAVAVTVKGVSHQCVLQQCSNRRTSQSVLVKARTKST